MRRNKIIQLWLCLLCLLPLQSMAQTLEYWFDDHYDQLGTTSIATTDAEQELSLDLRDNTKFPFGFHRLNMRVIIGGKPSSVYTSHVLKLSAGTASKIEYWVDDDQAHSKTVDSETPNNGSTYQFIGNLDLSDVTPGHHRLYYRAISNSGRTATAVSCTPILVKSKYYVENVEDLKVTERMQWFDNEEPETITLSPSENIYRWEKDFDTRKLSEGQHTLHMQFGNSAGFWSSPLDVTFNKTKVNEPVITVNAGVFDGTLKMSFNTVPFGYRYTVGRKYPSGERRIVDQFKTESYPATLTAFDSPGRGTYTYYVIGEYYNTDGKRQEVRSQDIEATFDEVASNVERGSIFGKVIINGRNSYGIYDLYINGVKVTSQSDVKHYLDYIAGTFSISDIPYGTEITIGIKCNKYKFNDQTLIVDENTKDRILVFNGVESEEEEEEYVLPENATHDLSMTKDVYFTSSAFEMEVKNLSSKRWTGNISILVINKKEKDHYDKKMSEDGLSVLDKVWDVFETYEDEPIYTTVVDQRVEIEGRETKPLSLNIVDMPKKKGSTDYYIYVFSQKEGAGLTKELAGTYSMSNPQVLKFDPSDCSIVQEKDFDSYVQDFKAILGYLKEMSNWGDPFKLQLNSVKNYEEILSNLGNGHVDLYALQEDVNKTLGMLVGSFFSSIQKTAKSFTQSVKPVDQMKKVYDHLKGFYNANTVDEYHKFFETSKQVLNLCNSLDEKTFPALKIYQTYLEVGAKMVEEIKQLQNVTSSASIFQKLVKGKVTYNIKVRKYTGKDGGRAYFWGSDFYPTNNWTNHPGQIKSIRIEIKPTNGILITGIPKNVSINPNNSYQITFNDVEFDNKIYYNDINVSYEAWMIIEWNNNRVTHVPILDRRVVNIENIESNEDVPLVISTVLQSGAHTDYTSIANTLTIIKE